MDPLPVGAFLTAIVDACHSGTMFDLDHYLCNNVYFPFVTRGPRKPLSRLINVSKWRTAYRKHLIRLGTDILHYEARKNAYGTSVSQDIFIRC